MYMDRKGLIIFPTLIFLLLISGACAEINLPKTLVIGDELIISGETNFNTDNNILIEVYPASFGPTEKYSPAMTGGASQVVPVQMSDDGSYFWSGSFMTEGWSPDEYMVRTEVIGKNHIETSVFTLTEPILSLPEEKTESVNTPSIIEPTPSEVKPNVAVTASVKENNEGSYTEKESPLPVFFIILSVMLSLMVFVRMGRQR